MIEIFVDGKMFAILNQESEWNLCTMLIRKSERDYVMLLDTNVISAAEAHKIMDDVAAPNVQGKELAAMSEIKGEKQ